MDFVNGLLYSPIDQAKKNDDLTQGDTLLIVNRSVDIVKLFDGKYTINTKEEKRIPFESTLTFTIGSSPKMRIQTNKDESFAECLYVNSLNHCLYFEDNVLTFTNCELWLFVKIVNRSNTNLTALYSNNSETKSLDRVVIPAKSFLPVTRLYCIYDDEGNVICCASLDKHPEGRFRISFSDGRLSTDKSLIIEDKI